MLSGMRKSEVVMGQPPPASLPGAELSRCMASGLIVLLWQSFNQTLLKLLFLGTHSPLSILLICAPSQETKPKQSKS